MTGATWPGRLKHGWVWGDGTARCIFGWAGVGYKCMRWSVRGVVREASPGEGWVTDTIGYDMWEVDMRGRITTDGCVSISHSSVDVV